MDMGNITTIVSQLGFPVAACCIMAYLNHVQTAKHHEEMLELSKQIAEMAATIREALVINKVEV